MNRNGLFAEFSKTVSYKIPEMIETSEKYLHRGNKVTGSITKLRYYQCIYEKIYAEYQNRMLLENRQKKNCRFCGNYWVEYLPVWASPNILCNC